MSAAAAAGGLQLADCAAAAIADHEVVALEPLDEHGVRVSARGPSASEAEHAGHDAHDPDRRASPVRRAMATSGSASASAAASAARTLQCRSGSSPDSTVDERVGIDRGPVRATRPPGPPATGPSPGRARPEQPPRTAWSAKRGDRFGPQHRCRLARPAASSISAGAASGSPISPSARMASMAMRGAPVAPSRSSAAGSEVACRSFSAPSPRCANARCSATRVARQRMSAPRRRACPRDAPSAYATGHQRTTGWPAGVEHGRRQRVVRLQARERVEPEPERLDRRVERIAVLVRRELRRRRWRSPAGRHHRADIRRPLGRRR